MTSFKKLKREMKRVELEFNKLDFAEPCLGTSDEKFKFHRNQLKYRQNLDLLLSNKAIPSQVLEAILELSDDLDGEEDDTVQHFMVLIAFLVSLLTKAENALKDSRNSKKC